MRSDGAVVVHLVAEILALVHTVDGAVGATSITTMPVF